MHLEIYQRHVTDGVRSLWKVRVDVVSKSCQEVCTVAKTLEKSAACCWVGFPFIFQRGRRPRCAVAGLVERGSSAYSTRTELFGV